MNSPTTLWRWMIGHFVKQWRLFAAGTAALLLCNGVTLAIPWTLRSIVESLRAAPAGVATLGLVGGGLLRMVGLGVLAALSRTMSRTWMYAGGREAEHEMRNEVVAHLTRLPMSVFRRNPIGDLLSRVSTDVADVRMMLGPGSLQLTNTILAFLGVGLAMFGLDRELALVALSPFPILGIVFYALNRSQARRSREIQAELGAMSARIQESLNAWMLVRCHGLQNREREVLAALSESYRAKNVTYAWVRATTWPMVYLISGAGLSLLLWKGGQAVTSRRIGLGSLVAFQAYYAMLLWPTIATAWTLNMIQRGVAAGERVHQMLVTPVEETSTVQQTAAPIAQDQDAALDVRGLTIEHSDGRRSLDALTLSIPRGRFVGLIGPTGSGKSTLLRSLVRLVEGPAHTRFLDGVDLSTLGLGELRSRVVLVPQEAFLFSRSVRQNLRFSHPDATDADVEKAARAAAVHDQVTEFSSGYDTMLGERGVTVSGGQRQRLALARSLVADPEVLLLDDVFSAVDTHTEEAILRSILALRQGRTTVLVSHRVSTLRWTDLIYVLDGGRVVQHGRHSDLMAVDGPYRHLAHLQELSDRVEALRRASASDPKAAADAEERQVGIA